MKHLGDITKIKGCNAPVVDCIIGGSPCQDLSVAGKRAGLAGERSGLYMEQIRIIKEMRYADEERGRTGGSIRPRYMVWENVPGAFSSNKGKDFAAVLEEAIKVADPEAPDVPVPEKGWPTSGCIMGDSWSVAWRVLDAQFWGVPQRRRRIALVADFGGQSAPEILFIRKGVSRDLDESQQARKATAGDARDCTGGAGKAVGFPLGFRPENVRCYDELATTLCNGTRPGFTTGVVQEQPLCIEMTSTKNTIVEDGVCPTLTARMGTGGNQVNAVLSAVGFDAYNQAQTGDVAKPLTAAATDSDHIPCVFHGAFQNTGIGWWNESDVAATLRTPCGGDATKANLVVGVRHIVRRLTPLECERLQGFPDGWTDIGEWVDSNGKKHKEADSPRYKALGNSIAIPPWKWVLKRLCACYERDATMASLFDGIGGFPYIWEQLNGKGSCLWSSEIEEFPMAVTKLRFGGNDQ